MNVNLKLIKPVERLIADNAPTILTGIAVVGTCATAYLAARGAYRAANKNDHVDFLRGQDSKAPMTVKEKAATTWMEYVPAVGAAGVTIGAVVCAHRISATRIAALTAAYSLSEGKLKEYKAKIEEKFGLEKSEEVKQEIAQDHVKHAPPPTLVLGEKDVLCLDSFSGRYFRSNVMALKEAALAVNTKVVRENYATLDDFWDEIGLPSAAMATDWGFTIDGPLELSFKTAMSDDDHPCLVVNYDPEPIRRWNHLS